VRKRIDVFCDMSSLAHRMSDMRDRGCPEYLAGAQEMNLLRGELCRVQGVAERDITPDGYNISQDAYERVRADWIYNLQQVDGHKYLDGARKAYAKWIGLRPDLTEGDDWFAEIVKPEGACTAIEGAVA
jgi:hypothetical protein